MTKRLHIDPPLSGESSAWREQITGLIREAEEENPRPDTCLAVNERDGSILIRILADEFETKNRENGGHPKCKVKLREYWIGVYCVTNRQYAKFIHATKSRAPDSCGTGNLPAIWCNGDCTKEMLNHPVTCVSWDEARAYADWAGLSLPTESQWMRAARGPDGLAYPWGNEWCGSKCLHRGNTQNASTSEVWSYSEGVSGYGTFQQSGNVWEWCADRVFRGGAISPDDPDFGGSYRTECDYRGFSGTINRSSYKSATLGFRVVRT